MDGGERARGRITEEGQALEGQSSGSLSDRKGRRWGRPGPSSRRCANLAEHLAMVSAVTDKAAEKLRMGIMLRDIGFIACSDEVAFRDDHEPNSNEHTVLGLEIISGLSDELVDSVVRYHHSTLKSNDYPTQGGARSRAPAA